MAMSHGYAAQGPKTLLTPFTFERRAPRERDVVIEILYCGVCHSDIHQARNDWGTRFTRWCRATRSWAESRALAPR